MPTFDVVSAEKKKSFTGKNGGEFDVWNTRLRSGEGVLIDAELVQRAGSATPSGSVEGTIENGEYGARFKKAQAAGVSAFRGKTPKEAAEIRRMNAQSQALKLLELEILMGKASITVEELRGMKASELLTPRIDFFFKDTAAAE